MVRLVKSVSGKTSNLLWGDAFALDRLLGEIGAVFALWLLARRMEA